MLIIINYLKTYSCNNLSAKLNKTTLDFLKLKSITKKVVQRKVSTLDDKCYRFLYTRFHPNAKDIYLAHTVMKDTYFC